MIERLRRKITNNHLLVIELGVLYAKYDEEKLLDLLRKYTDKNIIELNIYKLKDVCVQNERFEALLFINEIVAKYEEAVNIMMKHQKYFKETKFYELLSHCSDSEYYYEAIAFFIKEYPDKLNELLIKITIRKLDLSRTITFLKIHKFPLSKVKGFLKLAQTEKNRDINQALNEVYIEEEDFNSLEKSIEGYQEIEIELAQKLECKESQRAIKIAAKIYSQKRQFKKSIEILLKQGCYEESINFAKISEENKLCKELLETLAKKDNKSHFKVFLRECSEYLNADQVLEIGFENNLMDAIIPYMCKTMRAFSKKIEKIDTLEKKVHDLEAQLKREREERFLLQSQNNMELTSFHNPVTSNMELAKNTEFGSNINNNTLQQSRDNKLALLKNSSGQRIPKKHSMSIDFLNNNNNINNINSQYGTQQTQHFNNINNPFGTQPNPYFNNNNNNQNQKLDSNKQIKDDDNPFLVPSKQDSKNNYPQENQKAVDHGFVSPASQSMERGLSDQGASVKSERISYDKNIIQGLYANEKKDFIFVADRSEEKPLERTYQLSSDSSAPKEEIFDLFGLNSKTEENKDNEFP